METSFLFVLALDTVFNGRRRAISSPKFPFAHIRTVYGRPMIASASRLERQGLQLGHGYSLTDGHCTDSMIPVVCTAKTFDVSRLSCGDKTSIHASHGTSASITYNIVGMNGKQSREAEEQPSTCRAYCSVSPLQSSLIRHRPSLLTAV